MRTPYKICIFNHKGGVGKTTLTANIACALAKKKLRVLLVDTDPQCNLTSYFIEDSVVDKLLDGSDKPHGRTVWSALRPVIEGTGEIKSVNAFELAVPGVFLLPGDIRLSEFEEELESSWTDCFKRKPRGYRNTAAISNMLIDPISQHNIDFVFYDSGPNIGPLNRSILLNCDHFIVPVACDLFSLRALKTLGHSLAKWIRDWRTITSLAPDDLPLIKGSPSLLGYIPQRFRVYGDKPTITFASMLPKLQKGIQSEIVQRLLEIDPALVGAEGDKPLGEVRDFSIAAHAQHVGVPLWGLSGGDAKQKLDAEVAFDRLATAIKKRADNGSLAKQERRKHNISNCR